MSTIPREVNGRHTTAPRFEDLEEKTRYDYPAEKGTGWLTFAAVMLGFGGLLGFIDGIVAVSKSSFYVANAHYVFSDLNTWGWIILVVGAAAMLASFGVLTGSQIARWTGITAAALQGLTQLLMIQAYPFWSLCVFALDVLVIYALTAYGGSRARQGT
ncbi:MAG: DUF7144 family membrane protein [Gaiellaceae bacterium]